MPDSTPTFKQYLKRVFKISSKVIPLIFIAFMFFAVYPVLKPLLSNKLDWYNPILISQGDETPSRFSYLAVLSNNEAMYPDLNGKMLTVPRRIVFYTADEYESNETHIELKQGNAVVRVPKSDLSFNLNIPDLPMYLDRLNAEYAQSSDRFNETHTHLAMLPAEDGTMTFVMGMLSPRQAYRSVWSVNSEGNPTPLVFNFTFDRRGYRYRPEYTLDDILFNELIVPTN